MKGLSADPVLSLEPAPGRYLTGADCWAHLNVRLPDGVASRSRPGMHPPVGIAVWVTGHGQWCFLCQGRLTRLSPHRAAGSVPWGVTQAGHSGAWRSVQPRVLLARLCFPGCVLWVC